jgi:aldehyde dehydrogenase (NAD+)
MGKGLFIEPTIFTGVENKMAIAQGEVFGPVLSVIPFDTEDEAISIASSVMAPFGGFKDSGFGKERGVAALDEFLQTKNVMIDFSNEERDPFALKM